MYVVNDGSKLIGANRRGQLLKALKMKLEGGIETVQESINVTKEDILEFDIPLDDPDIEGNQFPESFNPLGEFEPTEESKIKIPKKDDPKSLTRDMILEEIKGQIKSTPKPRKE